MLKRSGKCSRENLLIPDITKSRNPSLSSHANSSPWKGYFLSTPHFPQKSQSNSEQQTSSHPVCSISFLFRLQMLACTDSNACAPYVALMDLGGREVCCFPHGMDDWNWEDPPQKICIQVKNTFFWQSKS